MVASDMKRWITDGVPEARYPLWTRGNAADVLPDPVTPLTWTFYWGTACARGSRDAYITFGVFEWDEFDDPDHVQIFGCFGGYFYNPVSISRLMGVRMPGGSPEAIDRMFYDDRDDVPPYVPEPWHESPRLAEKLAATSRWVMTATELPRLDRDKELADAFCRNRPELSSLTDAELLVRARAAVPLLQGAFESGILVSLGSSLGPGAVAELCNRLGDATFTVRLLAGIEVDSARPARVMWDLSRKANSPAVARIFDQGPEDLSSRLRHDPHDEARRFVVAFDEFLAEFGSRGPKEWDLNAPVWALNPGLALSAIEVMRRADESMSPQYRFQQAVAERDRLESGMRQRLDGDEATLAELDAALRSSQLFLAGRERYKTTCIKIVHEIRLCFLELGQRRVSDGILERPEQIFMLCADELDEFRHRPEKFGDLLRRRELDFQALHDLEPPFIINGVVPPVCDWPSKSATVAEPVMGGTLLTGTAASGGIVRGRARVVLDPSEVRLLEPGEILVASETDPSWTPLFLAARGVVVDVGAPGSHAAIVARELGIPCVVAVSSATSRICDGSEVTVDGNAGTVFVH